MSQTVYWRLYDTGRINTHVENQLLTLIKLSDLQLLVESEVYCILSNPMLLQVEKAD